VHFNRDIRPILSDKCFACHGFDAGTRKAGLRLDTREGALQPARSGRVAVVPGKPEASELLVRITARAPDERMPPPEKHPALTDAEAARLHAWIEAGAPYEAHWAFQPPAPDSDPTEPLPDRVDRAVDHALTRAGLVPRGEAPREALLRRLSLDLTGLPPTPAELDAFLADARPDAYARAVDRLLASPHFGERLAVEWLDDARFADTNGFQTDETRDMSAWRDWVIRAFNANQPFDQFTVEQLAGDLLPQPTRDQLIATGFNRNHRLNTEGGALAEEYLVENVADRVNTTATTWLALTLDCARCHDHKYDPILQREYYQFFAFFHTIDETGLGDRDGGGARGKKGNTQPVLELPSPELDARRAALDAQWEAAGREIEQQRRTHLPDEAALRRIADAAGQVEWTVFVPEELEARGARLTLGEDGVITASGPLVEKEEYVLRGTVRGAGITAVQLELLPDPALKKPAVGRAANGNAVISEFTAAWRPVFDADALLPLRIASASAEFSQDTRDIAGAVDGTDATAWSVHPQVDRPQRAVFAFAEPAGQADGAVFEFRLRHALPVGQGTRAATARFRLALTRVPSPQVLPRELVEVLALDAARRTPEQAQRLEAWRLDHAPGLRAAQERQRKLAQEREQAARSAPTVMIMREQAQPRPTRILERGQYDRPGEVVTPGVPSALPPLPAGAPPNRLGLARWVVDPGNPLTARVRVNRLWALLFGSGLVRTPENFGSQAAAPSHPELLDALAWRFVRDGWDTKAFLRGVVLSAAYRRDASAPAALREADPENRWLARAARPRLAAEFLRDQALAVAGLLNPALGGRSFRPYQPDGLWEEVAGVDRSLARYARDRGPELYRRSLYLFIKRTVPHPLLANFDASGRETCLVARQSTSTPLQALQLLNDPTFVEAGRALGERMLCEGGTAPGTRLTHGFRLATGRAPDATEAALLAEQLARQLRYFERDPAAAAAFLQVGDHRPDPAFAPAVLAAHAALGGLLLNLDETVTRP
jgi:hypothetical protein